MGTIQKRARKDGSSSYTATVRVKRDGKVVLSLSETFARRPMAVTWMKRKEAEAKAPGGIAQLKGGKRSGMTIGDAIDKYVQTTEGTYGRSKASILKAIRADAVAELDCAEVTSDDLVRFLERMSPGRKPQTVKHYLTYLQTVFAIARPAWGMPLDPRTTSDAMVVSRRLGLVSVSAQRDRRPTVDEMDRLMELMLASHEHRGAFPLHRVVAFAMFSARRLSEILRIRWADLEPGRVLVRDMKHPEKKMGNHQWVELPPEARAIIDTMPRTDPRIFPFHQQAVASGYRRATETLNIKDLHFHDLRHEGVSRLFEMGWTIPQVASVSGHRGWQNLQRYTHIRATGDKWGNWSWKDKLG